jgi:peptidoglycan/LPS O-acetylase OafA/YrhL
MRPRIQSLDGLRFLAAIGVLWIHAWTLSGNPRCFIGKLDIADILAIGGNGVDLFFVISGFCMYYFYASKSGFSYRDFRRFIFKRWARLAPAFYIATIVYVLLDSPVHSFNNQAFFDLLTSVFFLNSIFQQYNAASHFWTLGVEWQFYLIIPFLLIYQYRSGFKKTFIGIFGAVFAIGAISVFLFKNNFDLVTFQIFFKGMEFGFGVVAGRLVLRNDSYLRYRMLWLVVFISLTYAGRVLISKSVLHLSAHYYNLFKLLGFAVMGAGFAGILYLAITSAKWLDLVLGNRIFKTMGKISYSFYLWHGLILPFVAVYIALYFPSLKGIAVPVITTLASTIILYPVSMISYQLLEKPFLSLGNLTTK